MSRTPGTLSDWSHFVVGEDIELTMNTTILFAVSSRVRTPDSCNASRISSDMSTLRMPTLSDTAPSTRWR